MVNFAENHAAMCTILLTYDENNALARRKLAALLNTGLFEKHPVAKDTVSASEAEAHKKEIEEFLYGSRVLAAKAFADKL